MKCFIKAICLISVSMVLSGCAFFNTYHNQDKVSSTGNTSVDAKQRFLIYGSDPESTITKKYVDNQLTEVKVEGERLIYCAEPSPDALSAFTAAFDLSAVKPEVAEAALRETFGESAATIGIRTQSIQLLRDAMYRTCEAYLAGAISKSDFATLQKSYQKSMVTLVAIEQLARAVAPGQVMINTTADRTASQNIVELKKMLDKSSASVTELKTKKEEADKNLSDAKETLKDKVKKTDGSAPADFEEAEAICDSDSGKENENCKEYSILVAQQKFAEETLNNEQAVEKQLKSTFAKASNDPNLSIEATASISYNLRGVQQSSEVSKYVASTVQTLVSMVYMDDFVQVCTANVLANEKKVKDIKSVQPQVSNGKVDSAKFLEDLKGAIGSFQSDLFDQPRFSSEKLTSLETANQLKNETVIEVNKKVADAESNCDKVISAYATALQKAAFN